MLYVRPSFTPAFHGVYFSYLSENPFDLSVENRMRYRVLGPFIGYIFFLRGKYFFIVPLFFSLFLISAVYYFYRRKKFTPGIAFIFSCFIAFSCTTLIPLIAAGYTDSITYFFLFLAFVNVEKVFKCAVFFCLALLNHENSLFLLPALVVFAISYSKRDRLSVIKIFFLFILACLPHFIYRIYVNAHTTLQYSIPFYISHENISLATKNLWHYLLPAAFYAFKLLWIFPVVAIYYTIRLKSYDKLTTILMVLTGIFIQLFIAYDYTRMITLAFPAVLLSAEILANQLSKPGFPKLALLILLLNFLIPQHHYTKEGANRMIPSWTNHHSGL
jgi:hypothetical protein